MKEQKQTYLSPETETLVVRFEGMVCTSPTNDVFGDKPMSGDWSVDED